MQKLCELTLEKMERMVYNLPYQRGAPFYNVPIQALLESCKEIKKEVFSV